MIRKLRSGKYQVCTRKLGGTFKSVGIFATREAAQQHQRAIELLKTERMIAREGILSSVERILRCSSNRESETR